LNLNLFVHHQEYLDLVRRLVLHHLLPLHQQQLDKMSRLKQNLKALLMLHHLMLRLLQMNYHLHHH
jgi:hypothetical protein